MPHPLAASTEWRLLFHCIPRFLLLSLHHRTRDRVPIQKTTMKMNLMRMTAAMMMTMALGTTQTVIPPTKPGEQWPAHSLLVYHHRPAARKQRNSKPWKFVFHRQRWIPFHQIARRRLTRVVGSDGGGGGYPLCLFWPSHLSKTTWLFLTF